MAKRVTKGNSGEAASAALPEVRLATLETWPFGIAKGPVEGFLRSITPDRAEKIQNFGHSRLYPP